MNDPHHDHQLFEMNFHSPATITHHCPNRYGSVAVAWATVAGLKYNTVPDGKYMLRLADGTEIVGYVNNDFDGDGEWVEVTYDNDTREVDPREIVRVARREG